MSTRVYPLFLKLTGKRVLVVGAGAVALGKIESLLEAGARVDVVATVARAEVETLAASGLVELSRRAFAFDDVLGAWLVVSATNDTTVNREVQRACEAARVFFCAVDDMESGSAFFGSVLEREPFLVAISSRGEAPALTRLLREVIESVLPPEHWVQTARDLRARWKAEKRPFADRFPELVRRIAGGQLGSGINVGFEPAQSSQTKSS